MSVDAKLPPELPGPKRRVAVALADDLCVLPGLVALALGGSYARGRGRDDSDLDLGLYYRDAEPIDLFAVREVAERFSTDGAPVVTDFYEWGPWVNGGAWIQTEPCRVDFLYRSVDHVTRVIESAHAGEAVWDYAQQPVYGFHSVIYLGETAACVPLFDPAGVLAQLKQQVAIYPAPLRARIIQKRLWSAEFTLQHARPAAARGDVYNTAGCLARASGDLTQALFALNEVYFVSDKSALAEIEAFENRPRDYPARIAAVLAAPGQSAAELSAAVAAFEELYRDVVNRAGSLYQSRYP